MLFESNGKKEQKEMLDAKIIDCAEDRTQNHLGIRKIFEYLYSSECERDIITIRPHNRLYLLE